jgi:hypothetical protein
LVEARNFKFTYVVEGVNTFKITKYGVCPYLDMKDNNFKRKTGHSVPLGFNPTFLLLIWGGSNPPAKVSSHYMQPKNISFMAL